jgi:hypothetical protein
MNVIKTSPTARRLYLLLQGQQLHKGGLQCTTSLQNTRYKEATIHSLVMQHKAHISQIVAILPYTKYWLLAGQYNDTHSDIANMSVSTYIVFYSRCQQMVWHAIHYTADERPTIATNCHLQQPISKSVLHPKLRNYQPFYISSLCMYTQQKIYQLVSQSHCYFVLNW